MKDEPKPWPSRGGQGGRSKVKIRKKRGRYKDSEIHRCNWCGVQIPKDTPVVVLVAGLTEPLRTKLVTSDDGYVIPLPLPSVDKTVRMIVAGSKSRQHQAGNDIAVMCCSQGCGEEMKTAMGNEAEIFDTPHFG